MSGEISRLNATEPMSRKERKAAEKASPRHGFRRHSIRTQPDKERMAGLPDQQPRGDKICRFCGKDQPRGGNRNPDQTERIHFPRGF